MHLYHCGQRLEPKSLADLIQDGDKVVVLHATTRIPPVDTPVDYPTPRRTSSAHSIQHKPKTPVMQPPSTPLDPLKSPTDPPSTPLVASHPPNRYYSNSELAWIDFVFARRAFRLRRYGHTGDDPEGTNSGWPSQISNGKSWSLARSASVLTAYLDVVLSGSTMPRILTTPSLTLMQSICLLTSSPMLLLDGTNCPAVDVKSIPI